MGNVSVVSTEFAECAHKIRAINDVMHLLGSKWKMSIIARLCYRSMRYSEMLKDIEGISGKVLSRELRDLEMNNLIRREVLDSQPVAVSYDISEYGKTLKELMDNIADWGLEHRRMIFNAAK
jgi:DNA-binding HxlR family transcriptional regulator